MLQYSSVLQFQGLLSYASYHVSVNSENENKVSDLHETFKSMIPHTGIMLEVRLSQTSCTNGVIAIV